MANENDATMTDDHRVIWLEPKCVVGVHDRGDRMWCQDNAFEDCAECGDKPVKYIRADICASLVAALKEARAFIESVAEGQDEFGYTFYVKDELARIDAALAEAGEK